MTLAARYREIDPEGFETLRVISAATKFNRWMYETIEPYCGGRILEIGSGIGNISQFFLAAGQDITLSDLRTSYCDFLRSNFHAPLISNLDLVDPNFSEKYRSLASTFDTVFALNVVEHIEDDLQALKNCAWLLKPGGALVILVPAYQALYNNFDRELGHFRRYSARSLTQLFTAAGMRVNRSLYFNLAGIAGWFASVKVQRNKTIPGGQMKLYNALVPIFRILDKFTFRRAGLSVIVAGEKGMSTS